MISNCLKKLLSFFFLATVVMPIFVNGAIIVPDCSPDCGYYNLLKMVNNIIDWVIMIAIPVAAGVFAWAGFKYMTTGISDQKAQAKSMLWKVFWGLIFILSAWLIVGTIINALLKDPGSVPVNIS